jgi:hypothetical protein
MKSLKLALIAGLLVGANTYAVDLSEDDYDIADGHLINILNAQIATRRDVKRICGEAICPEVCMKQEMNLYTENSKNTLKKNSKTAKAIWEYAKEQYDTMVKNYRNQNMQKDQKLRDVEEAMISAKETYDIAHRVYHEYRESLYKRYH